MSLVYPNICRVCQVLDDGATNHDYCKRFAEEAEDEEKKRKRLMNEILDEHYREEDSKPGPSNKKIKLSSRKLKCAKCEFSTHEFSEYERHLTIDCTARDPLEQEYFQFPRFQGFNCLVKNRQKYKPYFVTEVCQPELSNHDNLSETCYFFIPRHLLMKNKSLMNKENVRIPFRRTKATQVGYKAGCGKNYSVSESQLQGFDGQRFSASFPNLDSSNTEDHGREEEVRWAINVTKGMQCVSAEVCFILTKSRSRIIYIGW